MATTIKVKRLVGPNPRRRRPKMSPKQIRIFGSKAQKSALRRKTRAARATHHRPRARNTVPRPVKVNRRRKRSTNPALVVTLGAVNPQRRNMPAAPKRKNARPAGRRNPPRRVIAKTNKHHRRHATAHHKRRNPTRVIVVQKKANRRHHSRRHNPLPSLFGAPLFGKGALELVGGGLLGVVATKFIPTLFPAALTGGITSSNIGKTVVSGVSAVVAGWAGSKVSPTLGQGVLFGGMMQTLSVALNAFLPSVYAQLNPQLGDLMPGQFAVPQNPIRQLPAPAMPSAAMPAGAQARVTMNGLARAYGSAW